MTFYFFVYLHILNLMTDPGWSTPGWLPGTSSSMSTSSESNWRIFSDPHTPDGLADPTVSGCSEGAALGR